MKKINYDLEWINDMRPRAADTRPEVVRGRVKLPVGRENEGHHWIKIDPVVEYQSPSFLVVHQSFSGSRVRGGQSWYYFYRPASGGGVRRITARQLSQRQKKIVWRCYQELQTHSPWVCKPFKDPSSPSLSERRIAYKKVARLGDQLFSVFSAEEYKLGSTYRQAVQEWHGGGFYSYRTVGEAEAAEFPPSSALLDAPTAIVEVEVWGRTIEYGKKRAHTYMRPTQIVA